MMCDITEINNCVGLEINSYSFKVYDKDDKLVNSQEFHNVCMSKRYLANNANRLVLILGTVLPADELKYMDENGNYLPGYAQNPNQGGATNNKPASPKEGWQLNVPALLTDGQLFGSRIVIDNKSEFSINWECMDDITTHPSNQVRFHGTVEIGYHPTDSRYNITHYPNATEDEAKAGMVGGNGGKQLEALTGIWIQDSGLFGNGVLYSHLNNNALLKRPTDRLVIDVQVSFLIQTPFRIGNTTLIHPTASTLYGHRNSNFEASSSGTVYLPQFVPRSITFSNYPVITDGLNGYCAPIQNSNLPAITLSRLTSPIIKPYIFTDKAGVSNVIDDGWGSTRVPISASNSFKEYGEWYGYPIFYYYGDIVNCPIGTIKLPGPDRQLDETVHIETDKMDEEQKKLYDTYFVDKKRGTAPSFIWSQWIVNTTIDEKTKKKKPILYHTWNVTIKQRVKQTNPDTGEEELVVLPTKEYQVTYPDDREVVDIIRNNEDGTYYHETYKEPDKMHTFYIFNLKQVKHPYYGNTYYNWNYLVAKKRSAPYIGPARSIVYDNICAQPFKPSKKLKGGIGVDTNSHNENYGMITLQIGIGDGTTTRFYHPFIKNDERWKSGTVISATASKLSATTINDYEPVTNLIGTTFDVYKTDDFSNPIIQVTGGQWTVGEKYPELTYSRKTKTSHFEINPIDLKFYPCSVLGKVIVVKRDIFSGRTLHYYGGNMSMSIYRTDDLEYLKDNMYSSSVVDGIEVARLTPSQYREKTYTFSDNSYNYTVIVIGLSLGTGTCYCGSNVYYHFFEPGAVRLSFDEIQGYVEFSEPPLIGAPVLATVKLLAPYFEKNTDFGGRFVFKCGQKNWNGGTNTTGNNYIGPKEWREGDQVEY